MARAAVKAKQAQKQAQRAGAQPAKSAARRGRRRGHSGGGNPNQQLFFMRLRRQAKFAYVILAVLFALTFAFVGVGSGSSGLDQLFTGLNIFGHHGGTSISKAQKEVQKSPKSAKAYRDLATAFEAAGKRTEAIGALQQLTQLRPKDVRAWNELASQQLSVAQDFASQYQNAASEQQLAAPSQVIQPTGTLGKALGNPIEQAAAQQLNSTVSNLYQQALSAYGQAVSSYKQVAKLQPDDANSQFQLAQAAQASGDTTTAIAAYKAYLKLNPGGAAAAQIRQLIKQLSPKPTATGTTASGKKVGSKGK